MANEGMLLTAGISLMGAATFFLAYRATRPQDGRRGLRRPIAAFFFIAAMFLVFAGGRILFGYVGLYAIDRALFYLAGICAFASLAPVAYTVAAMVGDSHRIGVGAAVVTGVIAANGIWAMLRGGITGPEVVFWATEYRMNDPMGGLTLLLGILVPAIVLGVTMLFYGFGLDGADRRRTAWVSLAVLLFYAVLTSDGLGLWAQLLTLQRLVMAAAAVMVTRAYLLHDPDGRGITGHAGAPPGVARHDPPRERGPLEETGRR